MPRAILCRMIVRPETAGDCNAISAITMAAFVTAAHSSQTEAAIVDALREAGALTLSLVAVIEGEICGHCAISPVEINGAECGWYGLGPVSVSPQNQTKGIGSALIIQALTDLRETGARGCVVLGEPDYYRRFGFTAQHQLRLPGVPECYFQALHFAGPAMSGDVTYHAGFAAS